MNQHSKRCGGGTRPVAVVVIVLCVGLAVAMVSMWNFRKPRSHQEMQTQPKAAVQTEIPKPEAVQTEIPKSEPVQAKISKPETVSRVSVPDRSGPLESSTATPDSQANPAASPLMDDHVNSPAPGQDDQSYTFSHDLNEEVTTFEAVNPRTQVKGLMTVTVTGAFRGKPLGDEQSPVGSHLQANQRATFSFVPYDPYSPSYSATVNTLQVARNTTNDSISFDFGLETTGSDGSSQQFTLREVVTVTEDDAQFTFEQLPNADH